MLKRICLMLSVIIVAPAGAQETVTIPFPDKIEAKFQQWISERDISGEQIIVERRRWHAQLQTETRINLILTANLLRQIPRNGGCPNPGYPTTDDGLASLMRKDESGRCLNYFCSVANRSLQDSWGNEITYEKSKYGFVLRSFGADGKAGGEGAAADIIVSR